LKLVRGLMLAAFVIFASTSTSAQGAPTGDSSWVGSPDFWIAVAANAAGIGLFVARVHLPSAAPMFGYATQAIGVPAAVCGVIDLVGGDADIRTVGLLAYSAWALGAAFVDHVLNVNYREPVRPGILVPYVVTYYLGIGVLSASQLENGIVPWAIAGGTCLLTVAASFYARARGAD